MDQFSDNELKISNRSIGNSSRFDCLFVLGNDTTPIIFSNGITNNSFEWYNFTTFDSDAVGLETGNVIINGNVTDNHFNLTLSDNAYLYGWIMDDSGSVTVSGTVSDNEVTIPDGSDFLSGFYFKSASSASEINFEQAIKGNQFNMNFYPEIVLITSGSGVINLKGNTDEPQLSSVNHDGLIQQSGSGICYGSPC